MSGQVLSWIDDLHQVKGNVLQLQSTLNQLLSRTPSVQQFKELKSLYNSPSLVDSASAHLLLEKLKVSLNSPHIKVAVRLKTLYDKGYFPFFLGLSRINFKHPKADRYVGYLLDYNPVKPTVEVAGGESKAEKAKPDSSPPHDTRVDNYPPSLPPIDNELLLRLIMTDKSFRQPWDYLELETEFHDFNNNHNRKLSILGESLLEFILVEILDHEFPKLHEDDILYLKLRLIATHVLAKLAYSYNMADIVMAQIPKNASVDEKLSVFRNVFLAYLAGMTKSSYTIAEIKTWVCKLYQPIVSRLHEHCVAEANLKNPYVVSFLEFQFLVLRVNNLCDDETKKIKYTFKSVNSEEDMGDVGFVTQLVLHETGLGVGTSSVSLSEAKQKAVFLLFEDPALKKRMFDIFLNNYRAPRYPATDRMLQYTALNYGDRASEKPNPDRNDGGLIYDEKIIGDSKKSTHEDDGYSPEVSDAEYEPMDVKKDTVREKREEPPSALHPRRPLPYGMLPPIPNMKKTKNI